jgi:histidinol-phosphate aminotransferase
VNIFWNTRVSRLSPYVPGEQPGSGNLIKLNTNENPYPPSPKVVEAIRSLVSGADAGAPLRLYPDPACTAFREAVALRYGVRAEQVFPGNGSDEVLAFAFGAFFEQEAPGPGAGEAPRALLFPDITYSFYPVYAGLWNLPFRGIPVEKDFSINPQDYCVPSAGTVIPNPNAPTGRALPFTNRSGEGSGALADIVEYQLANKRVVIIDEAYAAFGAESAVPFIGRYPNLLTVHTLSKSASLAGLRAAFAIGSAGLIEGLFRIRDSFNSYTLDRLALAGAAAAVADSSYYQGINKKVIATRERIAGALASMGFEVIPSRANFLFIRWKGPGPSSRKNSPLSGEVLFRALRDRGILVRHFNKPRIADYLRVSIGTDPQMDAFLEACGEITGTKPGNEAAGSTGG